LESRKDQLKKQIIEALKANDNSLYSLLKSQWAHRFGVESLEELKNLDVNVVNKKTINDDNHNNDQSKNNLTEVDQGISIKEDDKEEKEITNQANKLVKSDDAESQKSYEIKSYEIFDNKNEQEISISPLREYKNNQKVEALIPLPPKPKYSFLRKWLFLS
tara:strand:+ start:231 stop:713 length:483 start_codon:yes stop_codon:yes gene_type:complete